jgi:sigma-E factor negative regulatory protein RseA
MNTNNIDKEKISAFADGELGDGEVEAVLSALRDPEALAAWDAYHRAGDILRSEELAIEMSAGFTSKLMGRLAEEPAIVAPVVRKDMGNANLRRFGLPGLAAVAAAIGAAAWIAAPQLMVASKEPAKSEPSVISIASASVSLPGSQQALQQATPVAAVDSGAKSEMLRDSRLDAYLLAHQRFSPALYSNAQYTRSASSSAGDDK